MIYFIIVKKHIVDNVLQTEIVGNVTSQADADYVDENYNGTEYKQWVESNLSNFANETVSPLDFFQTNPVVFCCDSVCNYLTSQSAQTLLDVTNLT